MDGTVCIIPDGAMGTVCSLMLSEKGYSVRIWGAFPDDIAALDAIDDHTAAVIVEPIQAEAGVRIPSPGFLPAVRARTRAVGALLICDEVITGQNRGPTWDRPPVALRLSPPGRKPIEADVRSDRCNPGTCEAVVKVQREAPLDRT